MIRGVPTLIVIEDRGKSNEGLWLLSKGSQSKYYSKDKQYSCELCDNVLGHFFLEDSRIYLVIMIC